MFSSIGNMFKKKEVKKEPVETDNIEDMNTNDKTPNNQYTAIFSKHDTLDMNLFKNLLLDQTEMFQKFMEERIKTWK
jgi:hypothetical protein